MAIASLKRLQTQLAEQQQRAAMHRVQIRQLREGGPEMNEKAIHSTDGQAIQITTYPDSGAGSFLRFFRRPETRRRPSRRLVRVGMTLLP